jgi:hypothetical protein
MEARGFFADKNFQIVYGQMVDRGAALSYNNKRPKGQGKVKGI